LLGLPRLNKVAFGRPFLLWVLLSMHLLYVDESGSVSDPSQTYFVLGGVAVFERKTHWIEQELNKIAERFNLVSPYDVELHGSPMRSGRDGWKTRALADRHQAIRDALQTGVVNHHPKGVRLFAAVVRKASCAGSDPVTLAFEQITSRFDMYLRRLYTKHGDAQRGIMVFDKSSTEKRIQTLAREFKYVGHTWGTTQNYAEVPLFLDSQASRLIQLADLVAYSVFRRYEHNDSSYYDVIKDCFDAEGGINHGLFVRE
jgi:hypothetical protein